MLLTAVAVVAREHAALGACWELSARIEAFVDGPARWAELRVPQTDTRRMLRARKARRRWRSRSAKLLDRALQVAAARGLLHVVRWLSERRGSRRQGELSADVMDAAAAHGQLRVLEWLRKHRDEGCSSAAITAAAGRGDLAVVSWLHEHYPSVACEPWTMRWVLHHDDVEMAEWLAQHNLGGECTVMDATRAAEFGLLRVLHFIHESYPSLRWDTSVMDAAAASGRLKVLAFLHENRAEGATTAAMDEAAAHGHMSVVHFLHENRNEGCTPRAMDCAAGNGHLGIVIYLHEHRNEGCTTSAMDRAAFCGEGYVVRWLADNRCEGCTNRAFDVTARRNDLPLLQFLHSRYGATVGCTRQAVLSAIAYQNIDMLEWLLANYEMLFDMGELISFAERRRRQSAAAWLRSQELAGLSGESI